MLVRKEHIIYDFSHSIELISNHRPNSNRTLKPPHFVNQKQTNKFKTQKLNQTAPIKFCWKTEPLYFWSYSHPCLKYNEDQRPNDVSTHEIVIQIIIVVRSFLIVARNKTWGHYKKGWFTLLIYFFIYLFVSYLMYILPLKNSNPPAGKVLTRFFGKKCKLM